MEITNKVQDLQFVAWRDLKRYEYNTLKLEKRVNLDRLQKAIETKGFCFPFFVWAGNDFVIDGTGRFHALQALEKKGVKIPDLPVVHINADTLEDAKQLVLQVSSEFGETTQETLAEFAEDFEVDFETISFPDLDLDPEVIEIEPDKEPKPCKLEVPTAHCGAVTTHIKTLYPDLKIECKRGCN